MKISLNWLNEYVDITQSAEAIEKILTATGLEVEHYEAVDSIKGGLRGFVVGLVTECQKHPNADKLSLTKVDIGTAELLSIVCGAPNVAAGQKVIVAAVGTSIFPLVGESFVIQKAKIRGEASEGMICAEDEIGIGTSHDGIMVLPENTKIGTLGKDFFNVTSDIVFEIGLTANRGDAASHYGVARELATVLNLPLKKIETRELEKISINNLKISVENSSDCLRYSGIVLNSINVKPSPDWIQNRLKSIGLNPINNVVDITNYVLHSIGQPLHAFDLNTIANSEIFIRKAKAGEVFKALDSKEYKLAGLELVIADSNQVLCLAGVYGGKESGVSESTKSLFLESALFSPDIVRKGAKQHAINSDASFRFERGVNPENTILAIHLATELLIKYADAQVGSIIYDNYPNILKPFEVILREETIEKVCGIKISKEKVEQILKGLGIVIESFEDHKWSLKVPYFKGDVTREIDVIEELIRIHGFENIPLNKNLKTALNYNNTLNDRKYELNASKLLNGIGFSEIMTNSLDADKYYEDKERLVYISNPLSIEMNVMRQTMLYSGLNEIAYNKNRRIENTIFFEFGKVYQTTENGGFKEQEQLVLFSSGYQTKESWELKKMPADYYFLKSVVNRLCKVFNVDEKLTEIKEVERQELEIFDIKDAVYFAVIDWQKLIKQTKKNIFELQPLPKFPMVKRDLSLVLDKNKSFNMIEKIAKQYGSSKLIDINVFDVYEGKPLEQNQKSVSVSFNLYDQEKTMTDKEIDSIMSKLMEQFENQLNAVIRK